MSAPNDDVEDREYRWEISPHPYSTDYDTFVTDDDNAAWKAVHDAGEMLWDKMEPGDQVTLTIVFNGPATSARDES